MCRASLNGGACTAKARQRNPKNLISCLKKCLLQIDANNVCLQRMLGES